MISSLYLKIYKHLVVPKISILNLMNTLRIKFTFSFFSSWDFLLEWVDVRCFHSNTLLWTTNKEVFAFTFICFVLVGNVSVALKNLMQAQMILWPWSLFINEHKQTYLKDVHVLIVTFFEPISETTYTEPCVIKKFHLTMHTCANEFKNAIDWVKSSETG